MPSVTATSTSATSPTTAANNTSVGAVAWSNPYNILTSNDSRATAALNNQQSNYIIASNFGFTIPTNAVILAIQATVEKMRAGSGVLADTSVRLVKRGNVTGLNHASQGAAWSSEDATSTYGNTTEDLWGAVWTAADINSHDFGVAFSCSETSGVAATAGIDVIQVVVTWLAGYDSAPQVQERGVIQLGGFLYNLASEEGGGSGKVRETLATLPSPKIDTGGTVGRPSNRFVETHVVRDLRGGMGLRRYRTPQDLNRYDTGQNIDPLWDGATTLGPAVTSLGTPSTTTANAHHVARHTADNLLVYTINGTIFNRNFTTDVWTAGIDTLPGTILAPPVFANGRLFYPLGANGYSYHTAAGSAATDVATPTFVDFQKWDNKLYGIDVDGVLYSSPDDGVAANMGNSGNWTTLATIPNEWDIYTGINDVYDLDVYDDAAGDPIIYCRTTAGLWSYDAANFKWVKTRLNMIRSGLVSANHGHLGAVYRGVLYTQVGLRDVYAYDIKNPAGDDYRSPGRPDGLPAAFLGELHAWTVAQDLMFVMSGDSYIGDTASHIIYAYNGIGWHPIHVVSDPNYTWLSGVYKRAPGAMAAIMMDDAFRLYFDIGGSAGATNNTLSYLDLTSLAESPLVSTTRTYATSGNIELPIFDGWAPAQPKTAFQVRLKLLGAGPASAAPTETVQVAYRLNGSTGSYTNLGSAVAVNDEVTIPFGTGNVGLGFKSIQFRLTFASAGSTAAPKMEYFALDYGHGNEVLRAFRVRLSLLESAYNRSPQQQYDAIYAALKADTLLTFAYRDDADNVRSYVVKAEAPEGAFETGWDFSGEIGLTLVEFNNG